MSIAFILNPGYNTISNIHHTFWDQDGDAIKNSSLTQALEVSTSVAAPSHVITGGTNPAQLFMSDPITLETDAPQFKAPILQAPSAELEEVTELTQDAGITFLNDVHFTSGTGPSTVVRDIDGVGTLTCDTLKYTTLDPAITPGDASTWSSYPALTDVEMNNFALKDTTGIVKVTGGLAASDPANCIISSTINTNTTPTTPCFAALKTEVISTDSTSTILSSSNLNATKTDNRYQVLPGAASLVAYGSTGLVLSQDNAASTLLAYEVGTKAIEINTSGALAFDSVCNTGATPPTVGSFGTAGQIIQSNGSAAAPSWVDAPSASNWSSYAASSDVDVAGYSIKDTVSNAVNVQGTLTVEYSGGDSVVSSVCLPTVGTESNHSVFEASLNNGTTTSILDLQVGNPLATKNDENYALLPGIGALVAVDTTGLSIGCGNTSSVLLTYAQGAKAVELNTYGAIAFDSACNTDDTPPTVGDFGTAGQVIQSNGSSAPPSWVDAPTASNWSDYAATSSINTANNSITNASGSAVTISSPNTTIINNGSTELFIKANNDTVSTAVLHFQSGADPEAAVSGYIYMNPLSPLSQNSFTNLPNSLSVSSGGTSDLVLSAGGLYPTNCHISYAISQAYTVNPYGALAFNSSSYGGFTLGDFGTTGQVIQSNGSSAPPTWVNAPSASNWSTYDATSDVDLASYSLTDTTGPIKANKRLQITNTDNKQSKILSILSPIDDTSVSSSISLSTNTGFAGQNILSLISVPVGATSTNFGSRSGAVVSSSGGDVSIVPIGGDSVRLGYSSGTKAVTVNSNGALAFNSSYSGSVMTEGSFGSSGNVLASASSSSPPTWTDVNTLITKTDNILYVSKNGSDSNKGTIAFQYLTIQAAINAATLSYPQQFVIVIAPGVYSGNLSITKPNIT